MPIAPAWVTDGSPIEDTFGDGKRAVQWLLRLKHPKNTKRGEQNAFTLDEWQRRVIRRIYGPRHPDGTRKVRSVVLLLPRGNRKTSLCAALALLHIAGPERVPGGLVLSAAAALDQAREVFKEAALIIQHDPRMAKHLKVRKHVPSIEFPLVSTEYRALSADGGIAHGKTPSVIIADEIHAWRGQAGRDLWEALDSATVKVPGILTVIASTSGRGQDDVAWKQVEAALKVQRGEVVDEAMLPIIFMADREDDWRDEKLWHAVNPGMAHGYPDLPSMRNKAHKAEYSPSDRDSFCQFNLNVWLDKSVSGFVDMKVYDESAEEPAAWEARTERLKAERAPCWLGVDMSTTTDLTAVVAAFPEEDGGFTTLTHVFCPAENLRVRAARDGVPYQEWVKAGHMTATPGNVIDYRAVADHIRDLVAAYDVQEIGFDAALATPVMTPLFEDGLPVVALPLDVKSQAAGLMTLERAIVGRRLYHGGNPALRWCMGNVATFTGYSGLRTMHKGKSTDRIDAAFACWMAVQRASLGFTSRSIYDDAKKRPDGIEHWG